MQPPARYANPARCVAHASCATRTRCATLGNTSTLPPSLSKTMQGDGGDGGPARSRQYTAQPTPPSLAK
eukprot:567664-Pyramimonas_sp.AAC.1